ncbi:MAG: rhodanese-like domain-containing protein [Rhodoferax sp.]
MRVDKRLLVLCVAMLSALASHADDLQPLRVIGQERQFVVQTPNGPFTITRSRTTAERNRGFLQPLVPVPGVRPVTEIEVLHALNDPHTMVIDMREEDDPLDSTIPNTYHIPFNEVEDRLDELGCTRVARGPWDCSQASQVVAFCYGPFCVQSPIGIASMVRAGFPASKIAYYRGGMMDWETMGLTTVTGNRSTRK